MELRENQRIGKLMLVEEVYKMDNKRKRKYWKCKCTACGTNFIAREDLIKCGDQISCGCVGKGYRARYLYIKNTKGGYKQ